MMRRFRDRREAGRALAGCVQHLRGPDAIVLALPRGGVPVAYEVARSLDAPLDVIVVRKLGVPFQPELGMGAIGEDGVRVLDTDLVRQARVSADEVAAVEARERIEVARRAVRYRGGRPMASLAGRTAIIVDDGIATGGTAHAAVDVARAHGAARVVLAVPVAPPETVQEMAAIADEVVAVDTPSPFWAIGQWYVDFTQTSDDEVTRLLDRAAAELSPPPSDHGVRVPRDADIEVGAGTGADAVRLAGHVTIPPGATGVVVFAHGSGSSRHSPRNQYVARRLQEAGLGTLLFDLLTPAEALDRANVFDVEFLAARLRAVRGWLAAQPDLRDLPVGYFGASTGAAAALVAAAGVTDVRAVVSRGGRPDLAGQRLAEVRVPTLLVVGGHDDVVLRLNEEARRRLGGPSRLDVVPGATHLFEEPGALERVADLAAGWFREHLGAP